MSKITIIRDGKTLNALVAKIIKIGRDYREMLHVGVLSSLYHLAEHGQPAPLNLLYGSLTSNDQTALKQYVRKFHIVLGMSRDKDTAKDIPAWLAGKLVLHTEIQKSFHDLGETFKLADKAFSVVTKAQYADAQERRDAFMALCEGKLIDRAEGFPSFYTANNFATAKLLGDTEVFKRIKQLVDAFDDPPANTDVKVSAKAQKIIRTAFDQLESLTDNEATEIEAAKSSAHRKAPTKAIAKPSPENRPAN